MKTKAHRIGGRAFKECKLCKLGRTVPMEKRDDDVFAGAFMAGFAEGVRLVLQGVRRRFCPKHEEALASWVKEVAGAVMFMQPTTNTEKLQ